MEAEQSAMPAVLPFQPSSLHRQASPQAFSGMPEIVRRQSLKSVLRSHQQDRCHARNPICRKTAWRGARQTNHERTILKKYPCACRGRACLPEPRRPLILALTRLPSRN
jgi:hypothetical protein